jgi:hypothetical protein
MRQQVASARPYTSPPHVCDHAAPRCELSQHPAAVVEHDSMAVPTLGSSQSFEWHFTSVVHGRAGRRSRSCGRPWDYHVATSPTQSRRPSKRQRALIQAWHLDRCLLDDEHDRQAVVEYKRKGGFVPVLLVSWALAEVELDDSHSAHPPTPFRSARSSPMALHCCVCCRSSWPSPRSRRTLARAPHGSHHS